MKIDMSVWEGISNHEVTLCTIEPPNPIIVAGTTSDVIPFHRQHMYRTPLVAVSNKCLPASPASSPGD